MASNTYLHPGSVHYAYDPRFWYLAPIGPDVPNPGVMVRPRVIFLQIRGVAR